MNQRTLLAAGAVALALTTAASAVSTRTWRVTTYREFDEGEATGVLLSSLGDAMSGYSVVRADVTEAQIVTSATAPDGNVWLGTGDQAQLYVWEPTGKKGKDAPMAARRVAKLEGASVVVSLAIATDGTVYAGTLPNGAIWRVEKGVAKELVKLEGAAHVFALVLQGKTLYAATGPNGRVYAVDTASGKARVFWDSGEKQIMSLVADGKGGLYAGSADEAILYHLLADGSARSLHDFDGDEVRSMVRKDGTLYVAVNEFDKSKGSASASTVKAHGTKIVIPSSSPYASSSAGVNPARDRKGKGAVYRVDGDGRVEQVHALGDSYFTSLHVDASGNLFAAAGTNGRVYQIKPDRTVLTAFDLAERQVLTMALDGPHKLLGTGDAGALYAVEFTPPAKSEYLSKVFDAGFAARWGVVRWSATGAVAVETRAGNTTRPDKTWSSWQAPSRSNKDEHEGKVSSPAGRYLQFRASFGKSAVVRDVTVFYLPQNQRPRVAEIVVGEDPAQRLARAARSAGKPRTPVVKLRWKVENSDDDELVYRLSYREENELAWRPLGGPEPLTTREWEWNTETIPDGNYVLRVTASDERANPRDETLEHSLLSTPFLVDNRKPEVSGVVVSYPFASGVAKDSFSHITELAYSLDGGDWLPVGPRDAVFDQSVEDFTLRLAPNLPSGTHSLAVRAVDAAENVGATQTTFRVK